MLEGGGYKIREYFPEIKCVRASQLPIDQGNLGVDFWRTLNIWILNVKTQNSVQDIQNRSLKSLLLENITLIIFC